jgi:Family of unknown function (DUF6502)
MKHVYNVKESVIAAVSEMLVPIVRLMLKSGVAYGDFVSIVKRTFVRICEEEFAHPLTPASHARISILTGLARREVERFSSDSAETEVSTLASNHIVRVLVGWHEDKDFLGPYGVPRNLYFDTDPSGGATFCDLVRRYSPETSPNSAMATLENSGAVVRQNLEGPVHVTRRDLVIDSREAGTIEFFGRASRGFLDTSVQNMTCAPSEKIFQRWVVPDQGIREEDWQKFSEMVRERLEPVLHELDAKFATLEAPSGKKAEGVSVGVGFYLYREPFGPRRN